MGKISLQMYTMREHTTTMSDLENTLDRLKDIGFTMLQYSVPAAYDAKEVARLFEERGLTNDSVYCPVMKLEENYSNVIGMCELFNTSYVRTGTIPKGLAGTPAGYKMFAHYLNEVGAEYKKKGMKILYHFHAFEFIRFGNTTGIDIFLKESDPEVVQIMPDTHWIHSGGKSIVEFMEQYKDRYDYIHVKDFGVGSREALLEAHPATYEPIGEGNINWKPIIELSQKNNVKSYAIEQDECYGRDAFDCVKSSFDYLRGLGVDR